MFFTLDRTEENTFAVLLDDDGNKHIVPLTSLNPDFKAGDVYTSENGNYIYNEKETALRRSKNSQKLKNLLNKAINR